MLPWTQALDQSLAKEEKECLPDRIKTIGFEKLFRDWVCQVLAKMHKKYTVIIIEFFYFQFLMQHPHFSTINQPSGLLLLFSRRDVQNTENENVFSAWKLLKLTEEVNFGSERTVLDIKFLFCA